MLNTKHLSTNNEQTNIDYSFSNQPVYALNMEGKQPNPASTSRKPTDAGRVEHRSDGILTQNTSAYGTGDGYIILQIMEINMYQIHMLANLYLCLAMSAEILKRMTKTGIPVCTIMDKYNPLIRCL